MADDSKCSYAGISMADDSKCAYAGISMAEDSKCAYAGRRELGQPPHSCPRRWYSFQGQCGIQT